MGRPTAAAMLCVVLLSGPARASPQGDAAVKRWKEMDACAREAHVAHPDYTAAANAAREAALQSCLESGNLPPRRPLAPPQRR